MSAYQYELGKWVKLESERVLGEEGEDVDPWLIRGGFEPYMKRVYGYGDDQVEIYPNKDETAYIALISPFGHYTKTVYIDNFPSLMMFLGEVALTFDMSTVRYQFNEFKKGFEKLFQAQLR